MSTDGKDVDAGVRIDAAVHDDARAFQAARDVINHWHHLPRQIRPWLRWRIVVAALASSAALMGLGAVAFGDIRGPEGGQNGEPPGAVVDAAVAAGRPAASPSVSRSSSRPPVTTLPAGVHVVPQPGPPVNGNPDRPRRRTYGNGTGTKPPATTTPATVVSTSPPAPAPHHRVAAFGENEAVNLDPESGSRDDIFFGTEGGSRVIRSANADRPIRYIGRTELTEENCEKYGSDYYGSFKTEVLTKNDVLCFVTNEGRMSAVRLEQDPQPSPWQLPITFTTWS